jgi:hypothetical protein
MCQQAQDDSKFGQVILPAWAEGYSSSGGGTNFDSVGANGPYCTVPEGRSICTGTGLNGLATKVVSATFPYHFSLGQGGGGGSGSATLSVVETAIGTGLLLTESFGNINATANKYIRVAPQGSPTKVPFWFSVDNPAVGDCIDGLCENTIFGSKPTECPGWDFTVPGKPDFDWDSPNGKALLKNATRQFVASKSTFCEPFSSATAPFQCEGTAQEAMTSVIGNALAFTNAFFAMAVLVSANALTNTFVAGQALHLRRDRLLVSNQDHGRQERRVQWV